ncbi:MAG: CarD family transcriptional regulator [Candidatus Dojkabacteria bacterium]|nr:CarD family transcriptional regulator [Candidatus Dojkabacteria bacterium]
MQSASINTTNEIFLDRLVQKFNLPKSIEYISDVDNDFEELFAEILGRIYKFSVYISKDITKKENLFRLERGDRLDIKKLLDLGYQKVERVWEEGEFSVLGDVVIIWPYSMANILRISLWDNEIEDIEIVKPENRRAISKVNSKEILSKDSSRVVGSEIYSKSKLIYLIDDIERKKDVLDIGLKRIPGIYNYTDTHTTKNIIQNYKNIGYEVWYLTKDIEKFEITDNKLKKYIDKYFETENSIEKELTRGFIYEKAKLLVLTDLEVLGEVDLSEHKKSVDIDQSSLEILKKVIPGDYLVHEDHGIGIFKGLKELEGKKYLDIHYAKNDRLLIPFTAVDKITKYISAGRARPKLTGLNSGIWGRISQNAKKQAESIARELLQLYALRSTVKTEKIIKNEKDLEEFWSFVNKFEFTDTEDQMVATNHIINDYQKEEPMDRLLVGDVGFGKTEIAMRATFAAVNAGFQVAILAPTTVLVQQHVKIFKERFKDYPFIINSLSRFNTESEKEKVLNALKSGSIDIVIGTHSLLSKNVRFKNLNLVIIDEEQKFGVKQKEHLKEMRLNTNILSMTATPIPRTLNLSLMGIRDISVLATPPIGRKDIKNEFVQFSWNEVEKVIRRELDRKGQVFFLHNRVGSIQSIKAKLDRMFPNNSIEILHGQMSSRKIEQTMSSFIDGKVDVLLCTTIIENGIDIANVNTLIVDDASMFGLSQMYQIRGRIGRGDRQAYACFMFNQLKGDSKLRLNALKESETLGSGFILSNRDLEIRGAGDILGRSQSGVINSVGYGLYTHMLGDAVKQLSNE